MDFFIYGGFENSTGHKFLKLFFVRKGHKTSRSPATRQFRLPCPHAKLIPEVWKHPRERLCLNDLRQLNTTRATHPQGFCENETNPNSFCSVKSLRGRHQQARGGNSFCSAKIKNNPNSFCSARLRCTIFTAKWYFSEKHTARKPGHLDVYSISSGRNTASILLANSFAI